MTEENKEQGKTEEMETKKGAFSKWYSSHFLEFTKGLIKANPVFVAVIALCPALAVTTSLDNAIGMAAATTFVIFCSGIFVSMIRKWIPSNVRIPIFVVVIATFVIMVGLFMKAFSSDLDKALGIYIPLIVVNCMLTERAESFASKNTVMKSAFDGLGMGIGFGLALIVIGSIREILGTGNLLFFGYQLLHLPYYEPLLVFILAPGALLTLGLVLAFISWHKNRKGEKLTMHTGCASCSVESCDMKKTAADKGE